MVLNREGKTLESQVDKFMWSFRKDTWLTSLISHKPLILRKKRAWQGKYHLINTGDGVGSCLLQKRRDVPLLLQREPDNHDRRWGTGKQAVPDFALKQPAEGLTRHTSTEEADLQKELWLCVIFAWFQHHGHLQAPTSPLSLLVTCWHIPASCFFSLMYI